jgi:hypothetical protein
MVSSAVLVCNDPTDVPDGESAIVISELLKEIDTTESYELFNRLLNLNPQTGMDVDAYRILSHAVWKNSYNLHDHTTGWMEVLPTLYKKITAEIDDTVDRIECVGVSGRRLDLMYDISANEDLELEIRDADKENVTDASLALSAIGWIILSLFDAILTLLCRPFFSAPGADVLIKYPVFRANTFQPIEQRLDIPFDTTFTLLTVSYFLHVRSLVADETTVIPIRCFDTIRGLIASYWQLAAVGYDFVIARNQEAAVVDTVEDETGVRMEETVGRLYRRAVLGNVKSLLYAITAQRLFATNTYESLLLTSTGPTGKALAIPAAEHDIDTYILHHSITTPNEIYDDSYDRTLFSEGQIVEDALQETDTKRMKLLHTGLPKHLDIADQREDKLADENSNTVVVGTQPFNDRYRQQFIYTVVPAIVADTSWDIVIKVHPAEKTDFYNKLLNKYDGKISSNHIRITDSDLYSEIQQSDLLITVNSNVGIESVILGTPAVTYNMWQPELRNALYTTHGSVPSCSTAEELRTLIGECNLDELQTDQQKMLTNKYMVVGNSIDQIADQVQTELKK